MATAKKEESTSEKASLPASDRSAMLVHSAEAALKVLHKESVKPWAELSDEEKSAYRVKAQKYSSPGFSFQKDHDEAVAVKRGQGWKFSAIYDPEAKTDPSLVPYDQKSEVERLKDSIVANIISL